MKQKFYAMRHFQVAPMVQLLAIGLLVGFFWGCGSSPDPKVDTAEAAQLEEKAPDWVITVEGPETVQLDGVTYLALKQEPSLYKSITLERKGKSSTYEGIPLWSVIGLADGSPEDGKTFDAALWSEGYDITLTAEDGYSVTFNTKDIPFNALYLVNEVDDEMVEPRIVGDAPGNLWVKMLTSIELDIGDQSKQQVETAGPGTDFKLKVTIGDETNLFTIPELESSPYYTEGQGSFTTSAGTTYTNVYGGVVLADFLQTFFDLQPESTVTFVAMDGYEMSYSGETILDTSDGEWLLAFKSDGGYMPQDPGYIRTVKIGPDNPNIEGHLSVKMIEEIKVEAEGYQDFSLRMKGKMDFTLDRQTLQSCVNCHKKTVTYNDRKSGEDYAYTGFPVWRILGYSDDPDHAPHKQDSSILAYKKAAVLNGYDVEVTASDGFSITLDVQYLDANNDVILALYKEGEILPEREAPVILVWDKNAAVVPEGIKPVRNIEEISLHF